MNVADFEARALARQTARPKGREPALVGNLRKGVGLVHELAELVGPEERVDHALDGPGVHQVLRRKLVGVPQIHALLDGARHAGQAQGELGPKLLANGLHAAVAEVVDVVGRALSILESNELTDDADHILLREDLLVGVHVDVQPGVHAVTPHIAQVITVLVKEESLKGLPGRVKVGRLAPTQLLINDLKGLLLRVRGVLLEGFHERALVECLVLNILPHEIEAAHVVLVELLPIPLLQLVLGGQQHLALHLFVDHFPGVLVDDLDRLLDRDARCELAAEVLFEFVFVADVNRVGQIEHLHDLLVAGEAQRTKQRGDGHLLLAVDVGPQHVTNVRGELHPRTAEGNHAGTEQLRAVRVNLLLEERTGAAVELGDDDPFGSIHDERPAVGHERKRPQVYFLLDRLDGLFAPFLLLAREAEGGLQGNRVREALRDALLDRVLRGVELVVDELKGVAVPVVLDREVLVKDRLEANVLPVGGRHVVLHKVVERLQLDVQEVRIIPHLRNVRKAFARIRVHKVTGGGDVSV